jgi:hypothetical protein
LSLRERVRHSNFSSCIKCSSDRQRWINFRSAKRGNTSHQEELEVRALKTELQAHIIDVKAQCSGMMRLAQECASRSGWLFEYDDACAVAGKRVHPSGGGLQLVSLPFPSARPVPRRWAPPLRTLGTVSAYSEASDVRMPRDTCVMSSCIIFTPPSVHCSQISPRCVTGSPDCAQTLFRPISHQAMLRFTPC